MRGFFILGGGELTLSLKAILGRLEGVRQAGPNQWVAKCPVHDDQKPSLSIKLDTNRILLHAKKRSANLKEQVWQIRDVDGTLIAEHVRVDGPDGKRMWWRRGGKKGLGGLSTKQLPLYGVELLRDLANGATVVVCEGEKPTDAVRKAGIAAVGTVTGAATIPKRDVLSPLARFDVVLWADNDPQGKRHMERIARELMALGVKPRWITWSNALPKGDAADANPQRIRELVEEAGEWTPPEKLIYGQLLDVFRRWLYLPDDTPLRFLLSLVIGNRLPGDPLWGFLIGPSGSLKTELLNSITGLPNVQTLDVLTPNTFLSGKQRKDPTASLLKKLPHGSILVMRDFTTVLAMRREQRAELLAQLRKIYDGHLTKATGEGGTSSLLSWEGKIGLICGCTLAIEEVRSFAAQLGERFVYFHLPTEAREQAATQALANREQLSVMRVNLQEAVCGFLEGLTIPDHVEIPDNIRSWLVNVADFVAFARSTVPRDRYTREITDLPSPEIPTRLTQQLGSLACGHAVLEGRNRVCEKDLSLIAATAITCIPTRRRLILERLFEASVSETTTAIAKSVDLPTNTARRDLEDLTALKLVRRITQGPGKADLWELTLYARKGWNALAGTLRKPVQETNKVPLSAKSTYVRKGKNKSRAISISLSGDSAGIPQEIPSQTEKTTVPALAKEDDSDAWPICRGCGRKVPEVNEDGLWSWTAPVMAMFL